MKELTEFEEFNYNEYLITTVIGSAQYFFDDEIVTLQGKARGGDKVRQVEVVINPEDSVFDVRVSEGEGNLIQDFNFEGELVEVVDIETNEVL